MSKRQFEEISCFLLDAENTKYISMQDASKLLVVHNNYIKEVYKIIQPALIRQAMDKERSE